MKKHLMRVMVGTEVYYEVEAETKLEAEGKVHSMLHIDETMPGVRVVNQYGHEHVHYVDNVEVK